MFYILKIILESENKSITGREIIEKLETYEIFIDIKTVYSCVSQINAFFHEWIDGDMIVGIKKTGFKLEIDLFDDGELQFLLDSIVFHQDLKNEDKKLLQNKLLSFSSFHQQQRLVQFEPKEKHLEFSLFLNLSTIMKAIENKNVLSFQYINYEIKYNRLKEVPSTNGNQENQYFISPYQIVSQNNHYYVIGYNDKYKNELSTYRIDRMRVIQAIRLPYFDIREQFDIRDEIEKTTNMYIASPRDTLQIECEKKLLREVASRFGENLKAKKLYHNYYLITVENTPISDGLIGWIMMLQDQLKVIQPLTLRNEIKERVEKMYAMYHK